MVPQIVTISPSPVPASNFTKPSAMREQPSEASTSRTGPPGRERLCLRPGGMIRML
jgi:hypothetical protein